MSAPALSDHCDAVLDIAVRPGGDGASRLVRRRVSYPWSLGRGYPRRGSITIVPQAAGAGLLAGDDFRQRIDVEQGAALRVAPAGATLVHGAMPARTSRSSWEYVVEAGARASIAQEPYVLMEDADLAIRQDLVVDAEAVMIATEAVVLAPGTARARWQLETRVHRPDGTPLVVDRQVATAGGLDRVACLPGGYTAFATVLVLAPPSCLTGLEGEINDRLAGAASGVWGACAPLRAGAGLGVRIAARDGGRARDISRDLHRRAEDLVGMRDPRGSR